MLNYKDIFFGLCLQWILCNIMDFALAILSILYLQLCPFSFCNFVHFYLTINIHNPFSNSSNSSFSSIQPCLINFLKIVLVLPDISFSSMPSFSSTSSKSLIFTNFLYLLMLLYIMIKPKKPFYVIPNKVRNLPAVQVWVGKSTCHANKKH